MGSGTAGDAASEISVAETIDPTPGLNAEQRVAEALCIWDADITYELQVELLSVLQRIMEHFAAAAFSLQQSRPFDAVCIIVPGVICAISDAVLRRRATNHPSEVCSHLMGQDVYGRQLGLKGFGLGVGTFASQTETIEAHTPELVIARAAVLDYFESPAQRQLEKIFHWEEEYVLRPGRALIKWLRMISHETAFASSNPHMLLVDGLPETSHLLKNYPELKYWRDIVFHWKFFLNPDRCVRACVCVCMRIRA